MSSPRIQQLNRQNIFTGGKYVLYLMNCLRCRVSPAYSFASKCANRSKVPVLAVYLYMPEWNNLAQRVFALEGLQCVSANMAKQGVPLLPLKAHNTSDAVSQVMKLSVNACEVILDAGYLREQCNFEHSLVEKLTMNKRRCTRIEGNLVVPVQLVSDEAAARAQTVRSKLWPHVNEMLAEEWSDLPKKKCNSWKSLVGAAKVADMNIKSELSAARKEFGENLSSVGGEDMADEVLKIFINEKLKLYDQFRNVPGEKYQSSLSSYLHFGMISPIEILRKVMASSASKSAKDAYCEELIIRRELSHNFVFYYKDTYDKLECLPDWAKKTMKIHDKDKRQYLYTYKELEEGRTHDPYWNAAQLELTHAHKMHGYMRMYWAKKVVEWTPDYQSACKFLIEQNDKYELDGRDPNGYAGVMWNFGMHDRAHAERPVFGKLRYMNAEGLKRKYKSAIEEYVRNNYKLAGRKPAVESRGTPRKKARMDMEEF